MPNHYHLILRQDKDGGVSKFISLFQNSYTKFNNTKYRREGHLLKGQYKNVHIEDEKQLLYIHRYIHLNQYSSRLVNTIEKQLKYPYSSLSEYINNKNGICNKDLILKLFKEGKDYRKFIFDQADYQRRLEDIKHLILEL